MALIKCPECGGHLSNTVKQCVHCGCKITICSECATVIKGEVGTCPNCGYELKEKENPRVVHFEKLSDVDASWSAKSWFRKIYTGNNYIPMAGMLLGGVLLLIAVARVIYWKMDLSNVTNLFEFTTEMDRLFNSVKTMYVFFGLFWVASNFLFDFRVYYYAIDFGKWVKRNNLDSTQLLRKYMGQNFNKMTVQEIAQESALAYNLLFTIHFQKDLLFAAREKRHLIISTCLSGVKMILLCAFLVRITENYMNFVVLDGGNYITDSLLNFGNDNFLLNNKILILAIIIAYIVEFIYGKRIMRKRLNSFDAWINKQMPSHYLKYDKYIKNLSDFVVNTAEAKKK